MAAPSYGGPSAARAPAMLSLATNNKEKNSHNKIVIIIMTMIMTIILGKVVFNIHRVTTRGRTYEYIAQH